MRALNLPDALEVVADLRPEDAACVRAVCGMEPGEWFAVDRWRATGPAWTILQDGRPQVIGGMSFPSAWTGLLWMVGRPGITGQTWRKVIRVTRTLLACTTERAHPEYRHRIEAHVLQGWAGASSYVEHAGLRLEAVRQASGAGGENIEVWAWTGPMKGN